MVTRSFDAGDEGDAVVGTCAGEVHGVGFARGR